VTGALLNTATVLVGGTLGLLLGPKLPERTQRVAMRLLGCVTLAIGGKMTFDACKTFGVREFIFLLVALAAGIAVGSLLRIQFRIEQFAQRLLKRFSAPNKPNKPSRVAEGWVSTGLLFCVGPMTIIGSLQDGLTGDYKLIAMKAMLDGVASVGFAATFGWGVLLSALSVLIVQGSITLGANAVGGFFSDAVLAQIGAAGGVLVICIGLTLTGIKKLPVADYLPALVLSPVLSWVLSHP